MEMICSAVFPATEIDRAEPVEAVQFQCRPHWAILTIPALFLAGWGTMGFFFVSFLSRSFRVFGQENLSDAPRIIGATFTVSTILIALLYWHSYRRSSIRLADHRAILQTGPLFKGAGAISLQQAKMLTLRQSPLGRRLNYGTISIVGPTENLRLRFIPEPKH